MNVKMNAFINNKDTRLNMSHKAYKLSSYKKVVLLFLFFSLALPLRVPIGMGSVSIMWVGIALIFCLLMIKQTVQKFYRFEVKTLYPILIFAGFSIFSLMDAYNPIYGLNKLVLWLSGVLLMLIVRDLVTSQEVRSILLDRLILCCLVVSTTGILIIVSGYIIGVDTMIQLLIHKVLPYIRSSRDVEHTMIIQQTVSRYLNWALAKGSMFRNITIFLTPIGSAGFFGLILPIIMSRYLNIKRSRWNKFLLAFVFVSFLLTMCRGGFIAASIALCFVLFKSNALSKKIFFMFFILILVALIFSVESFSERLLGGTAESSHSVSARYFFLLDGLAIAKDNILNGVGFANYELGNVSNIREYPHNQYVELWCETGLMGMISYAFFLFYFFKRSLRRISSSLLIIEEKAVHIGIAGSILFFIIYSSMEDLIATTMVNLTFFVILGISEARLRHERI